MANTNKVTKREMFNAIKAFMNGGNLAYSVDDVNAFIDHEVELLDKKSANKGENSKKTAEQTEVQNAIVAVLTATGGRMTATEILKAGEFKSVQQVSAMLKKLVDAEVVTKEIEKKTSYFSVAVAEDTDEVAEEV